MIVWQLDENNDIFLNGTGNITTIEDNAPTHNQSIGNLLKVWQGEAVFNTDRGINYMSILGNTSIPKQLIIKQIEEQITSAYPTVEVVSVTFTRGLQDRSIVITTQSQLKTGETINVTTTE